MQNLKQKTFNGVIWSYVNQFGSQLISILPAMILTRLISPDSYGLIAMTGVFTGIAYQLADGGFGNALIQKKDADNLDYNSVFVFNICICVFVYFGLFFLSPYCAYFFNEPKLISIIRVSSLGIIILSFGSIQSIRFKKNLEFKVPTKRNLIVQILSIIIGVTLALFGFGVWALVWQGLSYTTFTSIFNWYVSEWKPKLEISIVRIKSLFAYGSKTMISGIVDYFFKQLYNIVIGKFYSASDLAYYNRGESTVNLFTKTFFGVFSSVTFPVFVAMQDNNERLKFNIRRFLIICCLVLSFVMLTLMVICKPLFIVLYSNKWDAAVPFAQILCINGMLLPIISILESVLLAKGCSGKFLVIAIIRKILIFVAIILTWKLGITLMIFGMIINDLLAILILNHTVNSLIGYNLSNLVKDLIPYLGISLCIAIILFMLNLGLTYFVNLFQLPIFLESLIIVILDVIIALSLFVIIHKTLLTEGYKELITFIKDNMGPKRILIWLSKPLITKNKGKLV